jgi:hypothetical protein
MNLFLNKRITQLIFVLLILSVSICPTKGTLPDPEWQVRVGDSITYTYQKFFDPFDMDGDENSDGQTWEVTDENDEVKEVTIKEGVELKIEIIALNHLPTIQRTIGGITSKSYVSEEVYVQKTIINQTYWEESGETLEGDLIVYNYTETGSVSIRKVNWKTGWTVYFYTKYSNATHVQLEGELSALSSKDTPGFNGQILLMGLFFTLPLVRKKKSSNSHSSHKG